MLIRVAELNLEIDELIERLKVEKEKIKGGVESHTRSELVGGPRGGIKSPERPKVDKQKTKGRLESPTDPKPVDKQKTKGRLESPTDPKPVDKQKTNEKPTGRIDASPKSFKEKFNTFPKFSGSQADRIKQASAYMIKNNITGSFCWDWCFKVYALAGCVIGNTIFNQLTGRADTSLLNQIQSGDWLYLHNGNSSDTYGNHSVIVLEKNGDMITTSECPMGGSPGVNRKHNLAMVPVAYIAHPKDGDMIALTEKMNKTYFNR